MWSARLHGHFGLDRVRWYSRMSRADSLDNFRESGFARHRHAAKRTKNRVRMQQNGFLGPRSPGDKACFLLDNLGLALVE